MSWGLGWKRSSDVFHLTLSYGEDEALDESTPTSSRSSSSASAHTSPFSPSTASPPPAAAEGGQEESNQEELLGFRVELDWNVGDDEDQVALKMQSQVMVALPSPQDTVEIEFKEKENVNAVEDVGEVAMEMRVVKRREPLKGVMLWRVGSSSQQSDGMGVLTKLMRFNFSNGVGLGSGEGVPVGCADHWKSVTAVSLCGLGLMVLPVEITQLPLLERLYLDNNKLSNFPPELGELKCLTVLVVDYNMLVSVPVELRECIGLVELSLEHNRLVRPLLDFRAMTKLRVLRLFGNPLEFLPDILPLRSFTTYLFAFFSLIFRFSSCHHPLLDSALAKIMQDEGNRVVVGKDENAVRQLISMTSSDNLHVVEQACSALSSLATDVSVAVQLMKSDIMQPIERVLKSAGPKEVISLLQVLGNLAFASDIVSQKLVTKDVLRSLKLLCAHRNPGQTHELFDLICGTSTGGMLAVALGIKLLSLEKCEEIYKKLGKLVFAEPVPKDNEAATWREKLDQLYKSSSQSFRVVVHGSKHSADQFERLLKEMCADEDGDLLIESAVKRVPKVFVVSTLVSATPAQPFIFRNYQYPPGTPEISHVVAENSTTAGQGAVSDPAQVEHKRNAFMGSCKHRIWQAIRASSAAPYYLDDYSDDVHRWQDGAIVANNPTIFAIREAQLLWPNARIDCMVSIGCGSVPMKFRKGGWRYLDTGQVLIESACSVDWVEEALSTLLPLLPDVHYFRFNPVDERCGMELDETDPAVWLKLEAATDEYIQNTSASFKNICERLLERQHDEKFSDDIKSHQFLKAKSSKADESSSSVGWGRNVLHVEAPNSAATERSFHHARSLESFCSHNGIKLSLFNGISSTQKATPGSTFPTPFASPLFTGSFPSSPLLYSPDIGAHRVGRIDLVPPLSLDGLQSAKTAVSPPESPHKHRQLSLPMQSLYEKLKNSPQVGVVHLALQNDTSGSILSWQNDVFVVAEPGELADKFLQCRRRKYASVITDISTVADLVRCKPCFQIGGVVHRYIGHQTQVMEDDQEIGAYMFRRTVPSMHLTSEDIQWMVGAWRQRIIIFTGFYGPTQPVIKAFLDSGAKAVICPSTEPDEVQLSTFQGSGDFNSFNNCKFEIGEEEVEDDDSEPSSPASDWDDNEPEKSKGRSQFFWDDDEGELSHFICQFYESLFQGGSRIDAALQHARASHRSLRYSCHFPSIP
ncbi:unnamed protein product [Withania somnifera]